jgi:hypothetical protein
MLYLSVMLLFLVARLSHPGAKRTALGVYTTAGFSPAFCGGPLGVVHYLPSQRDYNDVFGVVALI